MKRGKYFKRVKLDTPMHRLVDKVGVKEVADYVGVKPATVYFWLYREAKVPGQQSRGIHRSRFPKLIELAKKYRIAGMNEKYLINF